MKKLVNPLFLCICCAIVLIPVVFFNWKPNQISQAENRQLAEFPKEITGISVYMKNLNSYINDRVGLRDTMVQLYRQITVNVLHSNHDSVIVGKDGWLFYSQELPDYTGSNASVEQAQRHAAILKGIDAWCKERGIIFVFMVGPNKSSIYGDKMPDYIYPADKTSLDLLLDELSKTDIITVCPKDSLQQATATSEVYQRLDTHWNPLGSRYALDSLLAQLDIPQKEMPITMETLSNGDLLGMLAAGYQGYDSVNATVEIAENAVLEEISGTKNMMLHSEGTEKIVLYHDSFSEALRGYYSYYFHGPMIWEDRIDFSYVEAEKPKYLILSCVERFLYQAIEHNAIMMDYASNTITGE